MIILLKRIEGSSAPFKGMKIFFHGTKAEVVLILDPNVSLDTDELIEDGFRIIWNGLTTE